MIFLPTHWFSITRLCRGIWKDLYSRMIFPPTHWFSITRGPKHLKGNSLQNVSTSNSLVIHNPIAEALERKFTPLLECETFLYFDWSHVIIEQWARLTCFRGRVHTYTFWGSIQSVYRYLRNSLSTNLVEPRRGLNLFFPNFLSRWE
jgi:hypothetical protein